MACIKTTFIFAALCSCFVGCSEERDDRADVVRRQHSAIARSTEALESNSTDAAALVRRAHAYNELGEYRRAIEDCSRALEIAPEYAAAYNTRGVAYHFLKDDTCLLRAAEDYRKAVSLDSKFAAAIYNIGVIFHNLDSLDSALVYYQQAIVFDSLDTLIYYGLASVLYELGRLDSAFDYLDRGIRLNPYYPKPYSLRGDIHYDKEEFFRSNADYKRHVELLGEQADVRAYYDLAVSYHALEQYGPAEKNYLIALDLDSTYHRALYNLANMYDYDDEPEKAAQYFDTYLRHAEPDDTTWIIHAKQRLAALKR